ncbi:filamentous hemagglutinin N-terminal domain-containing protein [Campylobacter sp. RKI_CA19_01121]|uniref:two-partner secretion domain-containing protein n=1 Tax=Campylobacter sp. RKI_CA19_01121 TaxID=2911626 RepID=UPI0021E7F541|nr:filamentous hemagglutinin N-terminal domain-containing protein [Campylobacter sp. RKI_CA19_01121]MCV3337808.1 filamentous hemagglutinin N-terminal domain-containing protein [Campylobacter sp. RKI_CA19_01121]
MKKLANHIILSGVTVSMLFSPLMALPSGGKFTHGTSGSITSNGNNMNIIGNGTNSVIQWGGGFSIGQGESVNFGGKDKNYLNIAHGTSKSTIEGLLNAGGNNVFLINPNGVIITKTGTINANRFVASTSSMSDGDMWKFAKLTKAQGASFSPVFKPQKAGNVVNMGNINADDVLLIGNKVDIQGGKVGNKNSTTHLVGKNVYIDADSAKLNSNNINVTATEGGYIQRQMIKFANDKYNFGDNVKVNVVNYKDSSGATHTGSSNFKKALTIGNMGNEKDNAIEWWHFAKGWNEGLGNIREIDEFRLVDDIDFSGNQGKGVEGKDWQNYVNYCIEGLGCTSMIVGPDFGNSFTKTFDGQGYALKNINIKATGLDYNRKFVGIFGSASNATFKNINVDYMGGNIYSEYSTTGGFIGSASNSKFYNISLNNIHDMKVNFPTGGQAGIFSGIITDSEVIKISLNKIGNFITFGGCDGCGAISIGGFAGQLLGENNKFNHISISEIGNISGNQNGDNNLYVGGFAGKGSDGQFSNIYLYNIGNIEGNYFNNYSNQGALVGGFFGELQSRNTVKFENIYIFFNPAAAITGNGGSSSNSIFSHFFYDSKFAFSNIHIYYHENDLTNTTGDKDHWNDFNKNGYVSDKINIRTYNDSTQSDAYKDFLSKANTIEKPSKPTNPTDSDVILDSDDVISAEDLNKWLDEIFAGNYWVDIKDLSKIQGLSESIAQSISFLEALYGQKGMKEILEGISNEYKNISTKYDKFAINKANLLAFINDKLKPLVESSNNALAQLKLMQEQLKIAIAKYNDYVKKINENPAIKNEETLNALKAEVDRLNQLSGELATTIANNQIQLEAWQDKASTNSNEHFTIKGQFDNVALLIPDLEKVTANGNENDDYEKISRQIADLQKQTPVFEYNDEETEEVEESAFKQKGLTCIVSDNFKTMNPCIVGGL